MKKIVSLSITISLIATLLLTSVAFGAMTKMSVCHLDEYGVFHLISIAEAAFPAHVEHGDASPNEDVPGQPGMVFAEDCSVVQGIDVTGTWRGQSGITGTMGYLFYMYLTQDASGDITGTIVYDIGITRYVFGSISGVELNFVTSSSPTDPTTPYWADCDIQCKVTINGTSFHGYGTSSSAQNIEWEGSKQ